MTFYNRIRELDALNSAFGSPSHDFIVVYGMRRVGKTELLKEFCDDRPHIYFLAAQEAEHRQREKFVDQIVDSSTTVCPELTGGTKPSTILARNSTLKSWWSSSMSSCIWSPRTIRFPPMSRGSSMRTYRKQTQCSFSVGRA